MKILIPLFVALAAPLALVPIAPAAAQTQDICQTDISTLRGVVENLSITGRKADQEREGLIAKLDAASSRIELGRFADAVQKLTDFERKVSQMADQGKISSADAADLITRADAAIACVNGLSAG